MTIESTSKPSDEAARLAQYFERFRDSGDSTLGFLLRHPRAAWSAARALRSLPSVVARPTSTGEGPAVRHGLRRASRLGRQLIRGTTDLLVVPPKPDAYELSPARRSMRTKVHTAQRMGVHWRPVEDPAERRDLLERANTYERTNPREAYQIARPDNDDMLDIAFWRLAVSVDDEPLMLVVIPIDGEWATLRYFRTMTSSPTASAARYLMTLLLVRELADRGVRYLASDTSPITLASGLRVFQQRVGFTLVRVRLRRPLPS